MEFVNEEVKKMYMDKMKEICCRGTTTLCQIYK